MSVRKVYENRDFIVEDNDTDEIIITLRTRDRHTISARISAYCNSIRVLSQDSKLTIGASATLPNILIG